MDPNTNPVPPAPEPVTPAPVPEQAAVPAQPAVPPQALPGAAVSSQPESVVPPKKRIGKGTMAAIIGVVVLATGSAIAAGLVASGTFSSPEDKVAKAMQTFFTDEQVRLSTTIESEPGNLELAAGYNLADNQFELDLGVDVDGAKVGAEIRVVEKTGYIKVDDLGPLGAFLPGDERIDNQWYELGGDTIEETGLNEDEEFTCIVDSLLSYGKEDRKVLGDAYKKNPPFSVEEVGKEDGLTKYKLTPRSDEEVEKFGSYVEEMMPLAQKLKDCGEDAPDAESIEDTVSDVTGDGQTEVYLFLKGTTPKRVMFKSDDSSDPEVSIDIDLGAKVSVDTPEDAKPISDLLESEFAEGFISGFTQGLLSSGAAVPADTFGLNAADATGGSEFGSTLEKARDLERRTDINAIYANLEGFYNDNGYYPEIITGADLPGLDPAALVAPSGVSIASSPTSGSSSNFGGTFVNGEEYVYSPYNCQPSTKRCTKFVLVALQEQGDPYRVESLN